MRRSMTGRAAAALTTRALGARHQHVVRQAVSLLKMAVAHHQAVVLVPEHEGFRRTLDRVRQALVGLGITLCQPMLFGDVHGDADHVDMAGIGADDLRAGAHPDIVPSGMTNAQDLIHLAGIAAGDRPRQAYAGCCRRDASCRAASHERQRPIGSRQAEHIVHRP